MIVSALPSRPRRAATGTGRTRLRFAVRGVVQGVGFRPYVFRLATELGLTGWVNNSPAGVTIEVEGPAARVREFHVRLAPGRPAHSSIQSLEATHLDPLGYDAFDIRPSETAGALETLVLPDIATCPECRAELFDPRNRRHRYPFINCTHCGPRFSIVRRMPYDRPNTSMAGFPLCPACAAEYRDPRDRRFHAQPNACPVCGPHLELWRPDGAVDATHDDALRGAVEALRSGAIVAVKGLGGFQLLALAADASAVRRLRQRKRREAKPFALMFPDLDAVVATCEVSELERRLLESPEAPIVLLRRRRDPASLPGERAVAADVAPGAPCLGVMLPYTPLHHLLLADLGAPVVATSGNVSDEPICIDEREALERLGGIADRFLVHNRPIVRQVDDSIVRVVLDRELVLRRARGFAPLPVTVAEDLPSILAVGAHLKNTVALARGRQVFLSQHIGDLATAPALDAFRRVVGDLQELLAVAPDVFAADAHPDYASTREARRQDKHVICVQHHYAHVLACMAENNAGAPLLGVSWDGTGYGVDETVWGGEFLRITPESFERVGHVRCFRLPGGDRAVREPRRAALGVLYTHFGEAALGRSELPSVGAFTAAELKTLRPMLRSGLNTPLTSSAGRLFDAVASLLGLRQVVGFEGQAAMDLEFALEGDESDVSYPVSLRDPASLSAAEGNGRPACPVHADCHALAGTAPRFVLDWGPMLEALLVDLKHRVPVWEISAKVHNTLAEGILLAARAVGEPRVVLTGGCFQNRYLLERTIERLRAEGFHPYWHQRVPPNDGGIALGQVMAAERALRPPPCGPAAS